VQVQVYAPDVVYFFYYHNQIYVLTKLRNAQNRQYISFQEPAMHYDPIKDAFARYIAIFPAFRSLFYLALDMLLLRQHYVKRAIHKHFKDGDTFYDAGAGFCQYSAYILKKYPRSKAFAVDLKTDYLDSFARFNKQRFSWQHADLQSFVPEDKFNMAIAIDILEHIEDDVSAIKNLHTALLEGGLLIISTPSDLDEAAKFTAEHVRPGYSKHDLEQKIVKCGFSLLSSEYSYGFWGALSWRLLVKLPLSIFSKSKLSALLWPFYYFVSFIPAQLMMLLDIHIPKAKGTGIIIIARKSIDRFD
jgi:SAM-dependent methyltransferase